MKGAWGILNNVPEDKYAYARYSPMQGYLYEVLNLMDGKRNMLEIIEAVEVEAFLSNYQTYTYDQILEFMALLRTDGVISY